MYLNPNRNTEVLVKMLGPDPAGHCYSGQRIVEYSIMN